jgi:hypothetical protein
MPSSVVLERKTICTFTANIRLSTTRCTQYKGIFSAVTAGPKIDIFFLCCCCVWLTIFDIRGSHIMLYKVENKGKSAAMAVNNIYMSRKRGSSHIVNGQLLLLLLLRRHRRRGIVKTSSSPFKSPFFETLLCYSIADGKALRRLGRPRTRVKCAPAPTHGAGTAAPATTPK